MKINKNLVIKVLLTLAAVSFLQFKSFATSIDWSGVYRFELNEVDNTSLGKAKGRKSYAVNSLILGAKLIPTDGIEVVSQFNVFSNSHPAYQNSLLGAQWGNSYPTSATGSDGSRTNAYSENSAAQNLKVLNLYMQVFQEYGTLIVGRAPIDFGLGMTHSSGRSLFDHWQSNRDLIGYKFIVDSFYFMPMIAKVSDETPAQGGDITEQILHFKYDNKDNGTILGLWHQTRKAGMSSNDSIPANTATAKIPGGVAVTGPLSTQTVNFNFGRRWTEFSLGIEAGFATGETGVSNARNEEVKVNGFGLLAEFDYEPGDSNWNYKLKAGMASGDDPTTKNYEGFQFNKNYDVAMLLFNHRLGQYDVLTSNLNKDTSSLNNSNSMDDEAISNAIFIAPSINYKWSDRWDLTNTFVYAQTATKPTSQQEYSSALGFEWDVALTYKPRKNMQWVNEFGLLFPGKAFREGSVGRETATTYGFSSKAAISF